mmetsp:Transcript_80389/g.178514  ORF Transcript_80389/g.178514 Transcript_80389/m.178514 type:complete len:212 (+) Transcript_80389:1187-1822(+)
MVALLREERCLVSSSNCELSMVACFSVFAPCVSSACGLVTCRHVCRKPLSSFCLLFSSRFSSMLGFCALSLFSSSCPCLINSEIAMWSWVLAALICFSRRSISFCILWRSCNMEYNSPMSSSHFFSAFSRASFFSSSVFCAEALSSSPPTLNMLFLFLIVFLLLLVSVSPSPRSAASATLVFTSSATLAFTPSAPEANVAWRPRTAFGEPR